jgi:ABC-type multidrug transport system fused ATPase/permease subunit
MLTIGALVAGVVGIVVVMEAKTIGSTAAGIVLIYSLSFQENLTFLTRMHAECQMAMNSVERVREYSELEPERYGQDIIANDSSASSASPHTHTHTHAHKSACNSCCGKVTRVFDKGQGTQSFKAVTMDDLTLDAIESGSAHNALISSKVYVPQNWPAAGLIEFKGISLKYHSSSQPVLHKVSFKIPSRKKIGGVLRTVCILCHTLYISPVYLH